MIMKVRFFGATCARRILVLCLATVLLPSPAWAAPVTIARQGAFLAGGTIIGDARSGELSCDHGSVEYQVPVHARKTALLMWHSSSAAVWQNRWDGGEGFQTLFLRRGYAVYLWDGPRVGRANWGCEAYTYKPVLGRDQANFTAWRLGSKYPEWFPGVQFPTGDARAWDQAKRARYDEFDTVANAKLEAAAAAQAIDRIGPTVALTNSAGGLRALLTAIRSDSIKAIVAYENPGYVFPSDVEAPAGPERFGPVIVSPEEFNRLTRIPLQFVFGDNVDRSPSWSAFAATCRKFVDLINERGGHAEILFLPSVGLKGNTHIPFADLNNVAVADQLSLFLHQNKLDLPEAKAKKRR